MMFLRFSWIAVLAACCLSPASAAAQNVSAGKVIAETFCARCHGIKPGQKSKHRLAPEFSVIANRYSVWGLQEALAEGIIVGHADMPQYTFSPTEIDNLLAYMDTFTRNAGAPKTEPGRKGQPQ